MPKCTGSKCICTSSFRRPIFDCDLQIFPLAGSWFWLTERGQANFYMTAFEFVFSLVPSSVKELIDRNDSCSVINSPPGATRIAPPSDPKFCLPGNSTCQPQVGAKRPLYAYNTPTNVVWQGNENRPGTFCSLCTFDSF